MEYINVQLAKNPLSMVSTVQYYYILWLYLSSFSPIILLALSTSTMDDHEAASQHHFLSVTSAGSGHLPLSIVQSQGPQSDKATSKAYPIPARRKQKFRSKSNNTLNSIEEYHSFPASLKAPVPVLKRPLQQQYSNPELSQRIKPPRPPPPVRQIPRRTYTKPDAHLTKEKSDKSVSLRTPMVIDSRARQQRHSVLPLPKRPPLPYETVVHQSPWHQGSGTDGDGDAHCVGSVTNKLQETRIVVTTPADYEVFMPAATKGLKSSGNILTSGTKSELPLRGNENGMPIDLNERTFFI